MDVPIFGLSIFFLVLTWIFGGLRMWARYLRGHRPQLSDWLFLAALLSMAGQTTSSVLQQVDIPGPNHSTPLEIPTTLFWGIALFFVKMSILTFYCSLFKVNQVFRITCYVAMVIVSIYTVLYITVAMLSCIPVQKLIDKSVPGTCIDISLRIIWFTAINLMTDVLLAVLPLPVIWNLNLKRSKRILISLIFCAAFGVCAISAVRMAYLSNHAPYLARAYGLFTLLEPDLGGIVACLPLLRPIFKPIGHYTGFARVRTPVDLEDAAGAEKDQQPHTQDLRPILQTHRDKTNPTASERLRDHLYPVSQIDSGVDRTSGGDPMASFSQAEDPATMTTRRWDMEE